jgi:hypothetical protein
MLGAWRDNPVVAGGSASVGSASTAELLAP